MKFPVLLLAFALPMTSLAALDGDEPFICAPRHVFECDEIDGCDAALPKEIGLASFAKVDLKAKKITALGIDRVTPIEYSENPEGGWLIAGADGVLSWSGAIAAEDGNMTMSITGDGYTFSIYGHCEQFPD